VTETSLKADLDIATTGKNENRTDHQNFNALLFNFPLYFITIINTSETVRSWHSSNSNHIIMNELYNIRTTASTSMHREINIRFPE